MVVGRGWRTRAGLKIVAVVLSRRQQGQHWMLWGGLVEVEWAGAAVVGSGRTGAVGMVGGEVLGRDGLRDCGLLGGVWSSLGGRVVGHGRAQRGSDARECERDVVDGGAVAP